MFSPYQIQNDPLYPIAAALLFILNIALLTHILRSGWGLYYRVFWTVIVMYMPGLGAIFYLIFGYRDAERQMPGATKNKKR